MQRLASRIVAVPHRVSHGLVFFGGMNLAAKKHEMY